MMTIGIGDGVGGVARGVGFDCVFVSADRWLGSVGNDVVGCVCDDVAGCVGELVGGCCCCFCVVVLRLAGVLRLVWATVTDENANVAMRKRVSSEKAWVSMVVNADGFVVDADVFIVNLDVFIDDTEVFIGKIARFSLGIDR